MLNRPLTAPRKAFLVLALVAVTLLSLRTVCELWFTHLGGVATASHSAKLAAHGPLQHSGDPSTQCCAKVSDPSPVAPLQAAIAGLQMPQGAALAALVAVAIGGAVLALPLHRPRAPPPAPQSFYLRSARILR